MSRVVKVSEEHRRAAGSGGRRSKHLLALRGEAAAPSAADAGAPLGAPPVGWTAAGQEAWEMEAAEWTGLRREHRPQFGELVRARMREDEADAQVRQSRRAGGGERVPLATAIRERRVAGAATARLVEALMRSVRRRSPSGAGAAAAAAGPPGAGEAYDEMDAIIDGRPWPPPPPA